MSTFTRRDECPGLRKGLIVTKEDLVNMLSSMRDRNILLFGVDTLVLNTHIG